MVTHARMSSELWLRIHAPQEKLYSMPSMTISPEQLPLVTAAAGLLTGTILTWLIVSAKHKAQAGVDAEKLKAEQLRLQGAVNNLNALEVQHDKLKEQEQALKQAQTGLEVRLDEEKKSAVEKQALLERAELRLTDTFKALSAETLKSTQDQFLSLAKNKIWDAGRHPGIPI